MALSKRNRRDEKKLNVLKSYHVTTKIFLKKTSQKKHTLYIDYNINGVRRRRSLGITVPIEKWDTSKSRVTGRSAFANDTNLVLDQMKAKINDILLHVRIRQLPLTQEYFEKHFFDGDSILDFVKFWEDQIERQRGILTDSTIKQHYSTLKKFKTFQEIMPFYEITSSKIEDFALFLRTELHNSDNTIWAAMKNLKKFLKIAEEKGNKMPLNFSVFQMYKYQEGMRDFLSVEETKLLIEYYDTTENQADKDTLSRFLFSLFTGLRISDVLQIQRLGFDCVEKDTIFLLTQKTKKAKKLTLNKNAQKYINSPKEAETLFSGTDCPIVINRVLKRIAKKVGIHKTITFHVARHSFATQFLQNGGHVQKLQQMLDHSKITQTMIYVHMTGREIRDSYLSMDDMY